MLITHRTVTSLVSYQKSLKKYNEISEKQLSIEILIRAWQTGGDVVTYLLSSVPPPSMDYSCFSKPKPIDNATLAEIKSYGGHVIQTTDIYIGSGSYYRL